MFDKLSIQQRLFCAEYLVDMKAAPAAERAGFSASRGTALMKRPDIRQYIAHLMEKRAERLLVNQNNVLSELSAIGFSDIRNLFDADGRMRSVTDLDDSTAHALRSFKVEETEGENGRVTRTVEIRFNDKLKALQLAGKHLGMFVEEHHHTVDADYTGLSDEELVKQALQVLPILSAGQPGEGLDFL